MLRKNGNFVDFFGISKYDFHSDVNYILLKETFSIKIILFSKFFKLKYLKSKLHTF